MLDNVRPLYLWFLLISTYSNNYEDLGLTSIIENQNYMFEYTPKLANINWNSELHSNC